MTTSPESLDVKHLPVQQLSAEAFAPFGDVIEASTAASAFAINGGTTTRFNDLATVDTSAQDGRTLLSLFRAQPRALPFTVSMLERHPLGSQAFIPMDPAIRYLVVVASSLEAVPQAFQASSGQGINFHRGTWHHPLIALDRESDFLVVDRGGAGDNCDEVVLATSYWLDGV